MSGSGCGWIGWVALRDKPSPPGDHVLGRQLNSHALGLYDFASGITGTVLFQVSSVIVRVMFPTLSNLQDDLQRAKTAWTKACYAIAIVSFPAMAGIISVSQDLVPVVFGEQWAPAVNVLRILYEYFAYPWRFKVYLTLPVSCLCHLAVLT